RSVRPRGRFAPPEPLIITPRANVAPHGADRRAPIAGRRSQAPLRLAPPGRLVPWFPRRECPADNQKVRRSFPLDMRLLPSTASFRPPHRLLTSPSQKHRSRTLCPAEPSVLPAESLAPRRPPAIPLYPWLRAIDRICVMALR